MKFLMKKSKFKNVENCVSKYLYTRIFNIWKTKILFTIELNHVASLSNKIYSVKTTELYRCRSFLRDLEAYNKREWIPSVNN